MPRVLRCDEGDYNATTGECAAPYWGEDIGVLPPLEIGDAWQISGAIAALWALAWCIRIIRKSIETRIGV